MRIFLFLVPFAMFASNLGGTWILDDHYYLEQSPVIRSTEYIPKILTTRLCTARPNDPGDCDVYRPVFTLSYLIDYQLFGLKPWAFHLTNNLLHALNVLLLFLLALRWLPLPLASILSLAFALHPIDTEAVSWISARCHILAALFALLNVHLAFKCLRDPNSKTFVLTTILYISTTVLGFFSAETFLLIPLAVLLSLWISPQTQPGNVKRLVFMTALQFTVILSSFIWWNHVVSRPVTQLLSSTNLVNAVSFVERFIALSFIPSDTDFFFFYLPPPFSWLRHGIPLLLLIGAVATMVYRLRRPVLFLLGAALFVAPTLPVILILDRGERINERYFYLPWLGFCLMAAAGIYSWSQKRKTTLSVPWKKWITVAGTFWMIALAVFTILRNREWKDEVTLFQSSAERNPKNWQPYYHLAHHYRRTGETEKMLASYQEVLVRNPRHRGTANNLAVFYTERRDWERARFWLQALLKIAPDSPMTAYNFGVYYENRSEPAEAARWYQKALALNPDYIKARDGRSRVLRK